MPDAEVAELVEACEMVQLAHSAGENRVQDFLRSWPIARVGGVLEGLRDDDIREGEMETVMRGLAVVLADPDVAARPTAELAAALCRDSEAPDYRLRRLAVHAAGAAVLAHPAASSGPPRALLQLCVDGIRDEDPGVASAAANALRDAAAASDAHMQLILGPSPGAGDHLRALTQDARAEVRARASDVVARIAALSPAGMAATRSRGLLEGLAAELDRLDAEGGPGDALACAVAMEQARAMAEASPGQAGRHLYDIFMPRVVRLVHHPDAEPMTRTAAVSAGAAFIAAAAHAGHPDMATPGAPHKLLEMVAGALRDDLTPAETRDALLDAAGGLGMTREGAALALVPGLGLAVAVAEWALGSQAPQSSRVTALHALASLLGAHEGAGAGAGAGTGAGTHTSQSGSQSTGLPESCEDVASAALHAAAAEDGNAGGAVGTVLLQFLSKPFEDLRVACYRLITALAERPWGARVVCASGPLVTRLCDVRAESAPLLCQWRHSAVCALAAAAAADKGDATLQAWLAQLVEAREKGPFGTAKRGGTAPPDVATVPR